MAHHLPPLACVSAGVGRSVNPPDSYRWSPGYQQQKPSRGFSLCKMLQLPVDHEDNPLSVKVTDAVMDRFTKVLLSLNES